jgi:hypothetical protein
MPETFDAFIGMAESIGSDVGNKALKPGAGPNGQQCLNCFSEKTAAAASRNRHPDSAKSLEAVSAQKRNLPQVSLLPGALRFHPIEGYLAFRSDDWR